MTGLHTGHCRRRDNTAKALTQELSNKNGRPLVFLEDSDVTVAEALHERRIFHCWCWQMGPR